jgi:hypothetical protein
MWLLLPIKYTASTPPMHFNDLYIYIYIYLFIMGLPRPGWKLLRSSGTSARHHHTTSYHNQQDQNMTLQNAYFSFSKRNEGQRKPVSDMQLRARNSRWLARSSILPMTKFINAAILTVCYGYQWNSLKCGALLYSKLCLQRDLATQDNTETCTVSRTAIKLERCLFTLVNIIQWNFITYSRCDPDVIP